MEGHRVGTKRMEERFVAKIWSFCSSAESEGETNAACHDGLLGFEILHMALPRYREHRLLRQ